MTVQKRLIRIISGGQTGADQGALIAARDLHIPTGGIAPSGWLTEMGPQEQLLRSFGLVECDEQGYDARTRANVMLADGTLIVGPHQDGGTGLTARIADDAAKPIFKLPFDTAEAGSKTAEFLSWLGRHGIQVLNVAGNRESRSPGIQEFTRSFLTRALEG